MVDLDLSGDPRESMAVGNDMRMSMAKPVNDRSTMQPQSMGGLIESQNLSHSAVPQKSDSVSPISQPQYVSPNPSEVQALSKGASMMSDASVTSPVKEVKAPEPTTIIEAQPPTPIFAPQ